MFFFFFTMRNDLKMNHNNVLVETRKIVIVFKKSKTIRKQYHG